MDKISDTEQRKQLRRMLAASRQSADIFGEYRKQTREYLPGYPVFMREANFLERIEDGHHTMSEIAQALHISQGAATQIAVRLEKKDLIHRIIDAGDKRCIHAELTELGQRVAAAHRAYWESTIFNGMCELYKDYSDKDIQFVTEYEQRKQQFFEKLLK